MSQTYSLMKLLGRGNFGAVWKAYKNGRTVAVKILDLPDDQRKEHALKEAELLKSLSTPTCYRALSCYYDSQLVGDKFYLEMEYIHGETLTSYSKRHLTEGNILRLYKSLIAILSDISGALEYLHERGVIHRDVKPDNIMIAQNNQPKLIDIGLACTVLSEQKANWEIGNIEGKESRNEKRCPLGDIMVPCCKGSAGTPNFAAPEVLNRNVSYPMSDVFSLGVTIYFAATGRNLYKAVKTEGKTLLQDLKDFLARGNYPKLETPNITLNTLVNNMIVLMPLKRMTPRQIIDSIAS